MISSITIYMIQFKIYWLPVPFIDTTNSALIHKNLLLQKSNFQFERLKVWMLSFQYFGQKHPFFKRFGEANARLICAVTFQLKRSFLKLLKCNPKIEAASAIDLDS